jgi:DNA-binding MarR family transcriptional regulator
MSAKISVAAINKNLKMIEIFRHLDIEMPVGQIAFFLNAAKLEGSSLREISDAAGTKITTASRYLSNLGSRNRFRQEGLGLLDAYENPENRRQKVVVLTDQGRKVLEMLS